MRKWKYTIKLKHLLIHDENASNEDYQRSMNKITDILDKSIPFNGFPTKQFRRILLIPTIPPIQFANMLLDSMYDYADTRDIWIE